MGRGQAPAYPAKPADAREGDGDWNLKQIWSMATGGPDQPGLIWAGTLPGGLFRSRDRGESWELMRGLWDRPERADWFGGGYDAPGIHSICVDPRNSQHLLLGISCGGAWVTHDGGETWALSAKGMRATFMPPERGIRPEHPGPAPHRSLRRGARHALVPASQRHLAL